MLPTSEATDSERRRAARHLSPGLELHRRGDDLPAGQRAARGAAAARAHQAPAARATGGRSPGINLIYAGLNRLILDTQASILLLTGPGHGAPANLANLWIDGCLEDVLPGAVARPRGPGEADPRLLVAGRLPQPRRPDRPGHDPRGRRAGLRAGHGVRRGAGQPRPDRRGDHRRRRGRDGPDGRRLALEQVPRPGDVGRGAADPAPQRLQDRQPDDLQVDERRGADEALRGLRLAPADRRRPDRRPRRRAGRGARHGLRRDPRAPGAACAAAASARSARAGR